MVVVVDANIGVIVCVHGNEQYGLKVKELLNDKFNFLIANPLAIEQNVRFKDKDLNRSFPGNKFSAYYEDRQAFELTSKVDKFDTLIDLHSTSAEMELTGIISEPYSDKLDFVLSLGLKKLVLIPDSIDEGGALDKYHKGCVCVEIGPHNDEVIVDDVVNLLKNIDNDREEFLGELYEVFNIIEMLEGAISFVENYSFIKKGDKIMELNGEIILADFDFYPILANEKSYDGVLCFASKKVDFNLKFGIEK